ncbi:ATP-binding protein [Gemmobacter lanyuensis]
MHLDPRALSASGAAMPEILLVIASDPFAVRAALGQILDDPCMADLRSDLRARAEIVLAEVLNNVVEHAYADGPGEIILHLRCVQGGHLPHPRFRAGDAGSCVAGGAAIGPDPVELPEGGFGWHLIRCLTEDLQYCRRDSRNELSFRLPETRARIDAIVSGFSRLPQICRIFPANPPGIEAIRDG